MDTPEPNYEAAFQPSDYHHQVWSQSSTPRYRRPTEVFLRLRPTVVRHRLQLDLDPALFAFFVDIKPPVARVW